MSQLPRTYLDDIAEAMTKMQQERERDLSVKRKDILGQLRHLGVTEVTAEYDGYGDSGNIEGMVLTPQMEIEAYLDMQLTDFLWDVAYNEHPGFENNDGAFGEVTWDVTADKIRLTHNTRFTDYETTEHEDL